MSLQTTDTTVPQSNRNEIVSFILYALLIYLMSALEKAGTRSNCWMILGPNRVLHKRGSVQFLFCYVSLSLAQSKRC